MGGSIALAFLTAPDLREICFDGLQASKGYVYVEVRRRVHHALLT